MVAASQDLLREVRRMAIRAEGLSMRLRARLVPAAPEAPPAAAEERPDRRDPPPRPRRG